MQNRAEFDSYQQYPRSAYKKQIPTSITSQYKKIIKKQQPQQQPMTRFVKEVKIEDSRTEFYYNYGNESTPSEENCEVSRSQPQISSEQPTLPYYVVPVLYVPTRVLPKESNSFRGRGRGRGNVPLRQRQSQSVVNQKRYFSKTYDDNYYQEYYTSVENADTDNDEQSIDDHSYYNMEYTVSTSTVKEEVMPMYQNQYATETDVSYNYEKSEGIRPLKPHQYAEFNRANVRQRCSYANIQRNLVYNEEIPQTSKMDYLQKPNYDQVTRTQVSYRDEEPMQLIAGDCFAQGSNSTETVKQEDLNKKPTKYIIGDCVSATYSIKDPIIKDPIKKNCDSVKLVDCGTGSLASIKPKVFVDSSAMTDAVVCTRVRKFGEKITQTLNKCMSSRSSQTESEISAIFSNIIHKTLVHTGHSCEEREKNNKNRVLRKLSLIKVPESSVNLNNFSDMRATPVMNTRVPIRNKKADLITKFGDKDDVNDRKLDHLAQEPIKRVSSTVVNIITSIQKLSRIVQDMQSEPKTKKKQNTAVTEIPGPAYTRNIKSESPSRRIRK